MFEVFKKYENLLSESMKTFYTANILKTAIRCAGEECVKSVYGFNPNNDAADLKNIRLTLSKKRQF